MPSNTLESLTIEVGANSKEASGAIGSLIGSLRGLAKGVGTVTPAVRALNNELKTLARFSGMKLPSFTTSSSSSSTAARAITQKAKEFKAVASVLKEFKGLDPKTQWASWMYGPNPLPSVSNFKTTMMSEAESRRLHPEWYRSPEESQRLAQEYLRTHGGTASWAEGAARVQERYSKIEEAAARSKGPLGKTDFKTINESLSTTATVARQAAENVSSVGNAVAQAGKEASSASTGMKQTGESIKNAGEEAQKAHPKFGKLLESIGRIARTMLIRTALKSMMKAFSESWAAAYAFSRSMNGEFAKAINSIHGALSSTATNLVSTFAPALQALVPIVNVVANAISYLCGLIQWLFSLLGLTSDLFGVAANKINKFKKSSGGGNNNKKSNKSKGTAKNLLASWDELNVIQSASGVAAGASGSGGGGRRRRGGGGLRFADAIKQEIDAITSLLVGEGLLAVGLILCATGHWRLGIGLVAIGAAAIVQAVTVQWGSMTNEVKKQVMQILGIGGSLFLVLGLILAFTGHVGLGLGMILAGVGQIALAMKVSWGEGIESGVRQTIGKILGIGATLMLAMGIVMLFASPAKGLGAALIIAGLGSAGAAITLNWDSITQNITAVAIKCIIAFNGIKAAVKAAWGYVERWWDETIVQNVKRAWKAVLDFFAISLFGDSSTEGSIAYYASVAWRGVSIWWNYNVADPIRRKWEAVKEYFITLFSDSSTEGSIAYYASVAWKGVSIWWNYNVGDPIKRKWEEVKEYFITLFSDSNTEGSIAYYASNAWKGVSIWFEYDVVSPVKQKWNAVKDFLTTLFADSSTEGSIAYYATTAWDALSQWWNTDIYTPISTEWNNVVGFFSGIIGDSERGLIGDFNALIAEVSKLWNNISGSVQQAWSSIATWFETNVTTPISNAFKSAMNVIIGFINGAIDGLNSLGNFTIPGWNVTMPSWLGGGTFGWNSQNVSLFNIGHIPEFAEGSYDIPRGDLFIANEAGAELVGNMNGRTTVANQGQIIEGIQRGVSDANQEQNSLLRQQNELLRALLAKESTIEVNPSAEWGKFNQRSNALWSREVGGI